MISLPHDSEHDDNDFITAVRCVSNWHWLTNHPLPALLSPPPVNLLCERCVCWSCCSTLSYAVDLPCADEGSPALRDTPRPTCQADLLPGNPWIFDWAIAVGANTD